MKKIFSMLLVCTFVMGFVSCGTSNKVKTQDEKKIEAAAEKKTETKPEEDVKKEEETKEDTKEAEDESKSVTVVNDGTETPVSAEGKTVVIDPGHGMNGNKEMEPISPDSQKLKIKDPGGAQGVSTGVPEYKVNLQVAEKLKAKLEAENINVVMTKTEDSEDPGNIDRAETANKINADFEIRIHCDSAANSSAHGASMLVPGDVGYAKNISSVSRTYGETILESLVNSAGMYNRGISVRSDLTGFNWSKVPVVLVEMGFMSNPEEDQALSNNEYQEKLAQGLCDGIVKALNS